MLFFPRAGAHRLDGGEREGADVVCASIDFGAGDENPLLRGLPALLSVPLAQLPGLDLAQQLLFSEAQASRCGHGAVVDRLTEVLVIQLLRHAMAHQLVDGGVMAGLADARLSKAISALHADPARDLGPWMRWPGWPACRGRALRRTSRARSAFPPGDYLTGWRLGLARTLLRKGLAVKQVAAEVGYASPGAFGRVFLQRLGTTPHAMAAQRCESPGPEWHEPTCAQIPIVRFTQASGNQARTRASTHLSAPVRMAMPMPPSSTAKPRRTRSMRARTQSRGAHEAAARGIGHRHQRNRRTQAEQGQHHAAAQGAAFAGPPASAPSRAAARSTGSRRGRAQPPSAAAPSRDRPSSRVEAALAALAMGSIQREKRSPSAGTSITSAKAINIAAPGHPDGVAVDAQRRPEGTQHDADAGRTTGIIPRPMATGARRWPCTAPPKTSGSRGNTQG